MVVVTWVITRLCQDCLDMTCLEVCPVNCILEFVGDTPGVWPNQLYIVPDECIDCGACEPECPWGAIFKDENLPALFSDDAALNAKVAQSRGDFDVPQQPEARRIPSAQDVAGNRKKWMLDG
jgi:ferredoxin--NADP+ reductase